MVGRFEGHHVIQQIPCLLVITLLHRLCKLGEHLQQALVAHEGIVLTSNVGPVLQRMRKNLSNVGLQSIDLALWKYRLIGQAVDLPNEQFPRWGTVLIDEGQREARYALRRFTGKKLWLEVGPDVLDKSGVAEQESQIVLLEKLVKIKRVHPTPYNRSMIDKTAKEIRWLTPEFILEAARKYFGGQIPLDPATEPSNPTRAELFFTAEDNGLLQPWDADTWLNPPYGKQFKLWCEKIHAELLSQPLREVLALFPCGSGRPGTKYWQNHVLIPELKAVCYLNKRVNFLTPGGEAKKQNTYPSQLLGFNVNVHLFVKCFGHLGKIIRVEVANPDLIAETRRRQSPA